MIQLAKRVVLKEKDPCFCLSPTALWYFSFATTSHKFFTDFVLLVSREDCLVLEKFLLQGSLVSLYINILRCRTIFFPSSGLVRDDIIARE